MPSGIRALTLPFGPSTVATLPLEFYEAQKQKNVVQFTAAA